MPASGHGFQVLGDINPNSQFSTASISLAKNGLNRKSFAPAYCSRGTRYRNAAWPLARAPQPLPRPPRPRDGTGSPAGPCGRSCARSMCRRRSPRGSVSGPGRIGGGQNLLPGSSRHPGIEKHDIESVACQTLAGFCRVSDIFNLDDIDRDRRLRRRMAHPIALRGDLRDDQHLERKEIVAHARPRVVNNSAPRMLSSEAADIMITGRPVDPPNAQTSFGINRPAIATVRWGKLNISVSSTSPQVVSVGYPTWTGCSVSTKRTVSPCAGVESSPCHITLLPRTKVPTGQPVTLTPL